MFLIVLGLISVKNNNSDIGDTTLLNHNIDILKEFCSYKMSDSDRWQYQINSSWFKSCCCKNSSPVKAHRPTDCEQILFHNLAKWAEMRKIDTSITPTRSFNVSNVLLEQNNKQPQALYSMLL